MYDIYVEIDGKPKLVGNYDQQGSFGELALMYNMPRAATIVATTEGTLWAMVCTQSHISYSLFFWINKTSQQKKGWSTTLALNNFLIMLIKKKLNQTCI